MENNNIEKNTISSFIFIIILIIIVSAIVIYIKTNPKIFNEINNSNNSNYSQEKNLITSNEFLVVPTMQDNITKNSVWCGSFQLAWNDLQDNLVDGNVEFSEPKIIAKNLNKQQFTTNNISDEYYYKNWGLMTNSLKTEIETEIKNKFNEKSDILNLFEWPTKEENKYFFYSMLKKDFVFKNEFTILNNKNFKDIENIEYFGINKESKNSIRNQVNVLYYIDEKTYAVSLNTNDGDEIILARNVEGVNFEDIFFNINKKEYIGKERRIFKNEDTLAIPKLNIDELSEYTELENDPFRLKNGDFAYIEKAIQTIKMKLDSKGGSVKSEAGMSVTQGINIDEKTRHFDFDDEFVIFIKEKKQDLPYFAAYISDITLFQ